MLIHASAIYAVLELKPGKQHHPSIKHFSVGHSPLNNDHPPLRLREKLALSPH